MTDFHNELLKRVFGGRHWIVATDALVSATSVVNALKDAGATRALCIATSTGTGEPPDPEFAPDPVLVPVTAPDMMSGIRMSLDALANLPPEAIARVEAFDPERQARVLGSVVDDGRPVAGRQKYGARREEWQALEDKTRVDALWAAAGVAHAPSRVVAASLSELHAASQDLDRGDGCAWAGDNREGFNGAATYLRWVRTEEEAELAANFFSAHCDQVRVMPFLEGIPCSIHGFVFPDHVVVLRPCEMLVLRRPGKTELLYGRAASFWDPSAEVRTVMRTAAQRTGAYLRSQFDYRGAFTIDGVASQDGFLPTELNPRFGAALAQTTPGLALPLQLLNAAIVEGEALDFRPQLLEQHVLSYMDTHRAGGGMAMVKALQTSTRKVGLLWNGNTFEIDNAQVDPDATGVLGPANAGGFLRIDLNPRAMPVGASAAPRVAAALACLDAHWDLDIGPLEAAKDVRSAR